MEAPRSVSHPHSPRAGFRHDDIETLLAWPGVNGPSENLRGGSCPENRSQPHRNLIGIRHEIRTPSRQGFFPNILSAIWMPMTISSPFIFRAFPFSACKPVSAGHARWREPNLPPHDGSEAVTRWGGWWRRSTQQKGLAPFVASLFLVAMPGAPSSVLVPAQLSRHVAFSFLCSRIFRTQKAAGLERSGFDRVRVEMVVTESHY